MPKKLQIYITRTSTKKKLTTITTTKECHLLWVPTAIVDLTAKAPLVHVAVAARRKQVLPFLATIPNVPVDLTAHVDPPASVELTVKVRLAE